MLEISSATWAALSQVLLFAFPAYCSIYCCLSIILPIFLLLSFCMTLTLHVCFCLCQFIHLCLLSLYTSLSQLNTESHSHFLSLFIPLLLPHHLLAFSLAQQFISPHYLNYHVSCLVCIKYSITNSGTISYT